MTHLINHIWHTACPPMCSCLGHQYVGKSRPGRKKLGGCDVPWGGDEALGPWLSGFPFCLWQARPLPQPDTGTVTFPKHHNNLTGNKLSKSTSSQSFSYLYLRCFIAERRLTYSDGPRLYHHDTILNTQVCSSGECSTRASPQTHKRTYQGPEAYNMTAWQKRWETRKQTHSNLNKP